MFEVLQCSIIVVMKGCFFIERTLNKVDPREIAVCVLGSNISNNNTFGERLEEFMEE